MSLADHWDDCPFLEAGWHVVRVTGTTAFTANSGSYGVNFELTDSKGRKTKSPGYYPETRGVGFLIDFLKALGLTQQQVRGVAATAAGLRTITLNRQLRVRVEKLEGSKYHEVVECAKLVVGSSAPPAPPPAPPPVPESVMASAMEADDMPPMIDIEPPTGQDLTGIDIPF